jgi:hypothetical protein
VYWKTGKAHYGCFIAWATINNKPHETAETAKSLCNPEDQNIKLINRVLKLASSGPLAGFKLPFDSGGSGIGYNITNKTNGQVGYPNIPGPLTRAFNFIWDANASAPLHASLGNRTLTCPVDALYLDPFPPYVGIVEILSLHTYFPASKAGATCFETVLPTLGCVKDNAGNKRITLRSIPSSTTWWALPSVMSSSRWS